MDETPRRFGKHLLSWLSLVGAAVPPQDPNDDEDEQNEEDGGEEDDDREPAAMMPIMDATEARPLGRPGAAAHASQPAAGRTEVLHVETAPAASAAATRAGKGRPAGSSP
jgi:hypothetical protein